MASSMDSIKKKMQSMKFERDTYIQNADEADRQIKEFEDKIRAVSINSCSLIKANYVKI
jgi:hypothetical protein